MRTLIIGGIEVPLRSSHTLEQTYSPIQSTSKRRMSDGALSVQTAWSGKILTEINGSGQFPAGLQSLDYSGNLVVKCIAERTITSASNVIDVPAKRRSDYGVEGRALVGSAWQSTPVTMSTDEATLTAVADATAYQALYWPELTCSFDPPEESNRVRGTGNTWSLRGEEV